MWIHENFMKVVLFSTAIATLAASSAHIVESPSLRYHICSSIGYGGVAEVFVASIAERSSNSANCARNATTVILKCNKDGIPEAIRAEFAYMSTLQSSGFTPNPIELFDRDGNKHLPCLSMQKMGANLETLRSVYSGVWPVQTLGSIGAYMLRSLRSLHNDHSLVHRDLHAGNICLGNTSSGLSSSLHMIDLGDMRPLVSDERASASFYRIDDVRQMILNIRFLLDGDHAYYVTKRYVYDANAICQGSVPRSLCDALKYIFELSNESESVDYDYLISKMVEMTGDANSGEPNVLWEPLIARVGVPDDLDTLTLIPPVDTIPHSSVLEVHTTNNPERAFIVDNNQITTTPIAETLVGETGKSSFESRNDRTILVILLSIVALSSFVNV
jgi:hypothetical protein